MGWFSGTVLLIGIGSAVHAVLRCRSAESAIAWGLGLVAFPWIAVPLYWLAGRPRRHVVPRSSDDAPPPPGASREDLERALASVEALAQPFGDATTKLTGSIGVRFNRVDLSADGQAALDRVVADVERAERYVLVQVGTANDDDGARRLRAAVSAAAHRGVPVYFSHDGVGEHGLPHVALDELRKAGAHVAELGGPTGRWDRLRPRHRYRRSLGVVDGHVCWIGGRGTGRPAVDAPGPSYPSTVHLEGPVSQQAQAVFARDWSAATGDTLELDWAPRPAPDGADVVAQIVATDPGGTLELAEPLFLHALATARTRVWISTGAFVPTDAIAAMLRLTALRGVEVCVLLPLRSGPGFGPVVDLAAMWTARQLDGAGIRFFGRAGDALPANLLLVDDTLSFVGSACLDHRSFRSHFKAGALIVDSAFAGEVQAMLERDFETAEPYDPAQLDAAPFHRRVAAAFARLAAPAL